MTEVAVPTWSEQVRVRRRALGLTQRELAEAAGLTQQAVSYIERGAGVPRVTTMLRLAQVLGTTLETLLCAGDRAALPRPCGTRVPRRGRGGAVVGGASRR